MTDCRSQDGRFKKDNHEHEYLENFIDQRLEYLSFKPATVSHAGFVKSFDGLGHCPYPDKAVTLAVCYDNGSTLRTVIARWNAEGDEL